MAGFVLFLVLQGIIPFFVVSGMWRRREWARRDLALRILGGGVYVAFVFLVLPWGHIPMLLRYLWPLLYAAGAARAALSLRKGRPQGEPPNGRVSLAWSLVPALIFGMQIVNAVRGRFPGETPVPMRFPLREGVYLVHHGGAHRTINYHQMVETQKYALDIGALNAASATSWGIAPKQLDRYAVWGHTLYSPCDAVVRSAVDGLPDHTPPDGDPENPAGNHVELEGDGVRIYLAHMQKGSIRVKEGDRVKAGDPLGKVGNSGNTSEPHLHIHAVRGGDALFDGVGVPLAFDGRFLVRNDIVFGRR